MTLLDILLTIAAGSGWLTAIVLMSILPRQSKAPLTRGETDAERVRIMREAALKLLKESAQNALNGWFDVAEAQRRSAENLFALAGQLEPPAHPGGKPGSLSLVKEE